MELKHKDTAEENTKLLPGGWRIGDTCIMIVNKAKGYTYQYTITGYDGRYFTVKDKQNFHHAHVSRLFHSKEEARASLKMKEGGLNEVSE